MKAKLINFVKENKYVYIMYYYVMSGVVNFIKLFLKNDEKLILFTSFAGRHYNDNPKAIYDAMLKDERFKDYKMVWAFRNPEKFPDVPNRIKIDTMDYYKTALKARIWVTNTYIERALNFKGIKTYYFNTTHTLLPKFMGDDIDLKNTFTTRSEHSADCYSIQCEFERRALKKQQQQFAQVIGYPKNDKIANAKPEYAKMIRERLNVPEGKKVVLYAPTYREDSPWASTCPLDFKKWERILGHDFVVWFRAHPTVASNTKIDSSTGFIFDVSSYPDNTDLLIAADILISDYSGIFFEYGVQNKPMYSFPYDYEEYTSLRGLYMDVRKVIPGGSLEEEALLEHIKEGFTEEEAQMLADFRSKYITEYGHATEKALDIIAKGIGL